MFILNTRNRKGNVKLRKIMYYDLFMDVILDLKENNNFASNKHVQ